MPLRLTCRLPERPLQQPLIPGEHLVGADAACAIRLPHPTVSGRHARLLVAGGGVEVEDLGSSNGTFLSGRRLRGRTVVAPGTLLCFGGITAQLEEIPDGDDVEAFRLPARDLLEGIPENDAPGRVTWASSQMEGFCLKALPALLDQLAAGAGEVEMASRVGAALWEHFPLAALELGPSPTASRGEKLGPWYVARRPDVPILCTLAAEPSGRIRRQDEGASVELTFWPPRVASFYAPVADLGLSLLRLARRPALQRAGRGSGLLAAARPHPAVPAPLPAPVTVHQHVRRLYENAARVAGGEVSVLIRGESGTGKEVLARYVHRASGRTPEQFIALNCAALPRDLLELELFGIEAGVATGVDARAGKFELADGGTLFLDEIGDMALETQARILRVLQEKTVYRLGAKTPKAVRVRVIAATNRPLEALIRRGEFRSDLYYRISGWEVELPPLRRRPRDVANLAAYFLGEEAARLGRREIGISRSAMEALTRFDWPGNVRELQHEIARGVLLLADGELLETRHLRSAVVAGGAAEGTSLRETLHRVERERIEEALAEAGGQLLEAARSLDVSRSTLYRRIRDLGLQLPAQ